MNSRLRRLRFVTLALALSAGLLQPLAVEAQPVPSSYGVRGGFNLARIYGDTYSDLGTRLGLLVGGYAEFPYSDQISIQAGLNWSQEGARNANYDFSSFSTVIYDQVLKYNFLQIPVLARFHSAAGWNFLAGPQLGIRLASNETRTIVSGSPSPTDMSAGVRDLNNRIRFFYLSLAGGAERQLAEKVGGDVRFVFSPFDLVKNDAGDSEGTFPLILQFSVRYRLSPSD